MADYTRFDALILDRIKEGFSTFCDIHAAGVREEAIELCRDDGVDEPFRMTDRRLQAMRKRGLITYSRKTGWSANG